MPDCVNRNLSEICIPPDAPVRVALEKIDRNGTGMVLMVDDAGKLLATVTDGDLRRGLLHGANLETPVCKTWGLSPEQHRAEPVTGSIDADPAALLAVLRERAVRQLPLLDATGKVAGLAALENLLPSEAVPIEAVIMAGGFGTRLKPLTDAVPKPMLHVGDKPILERIVNQLQQSGVHRVQMTTHYRPDAIKDHFGDGSSFGLDIDYVTEDQPMGTAGALGLIEESDEPILVMNGDILTRVDLRAMIAFHREHNAELSVAVRQYDVPVPYGVINCDGAYVQSVEEKPVLKFFVNAGIYLLEPSARRSIPKGRRFDMTDLIQALNAEKRAVVAFPIVEYWLDIGQHVDFERAQEDVKTWEANQ